MTEDDRLIQDTLERLRNKTPNKTDQAVSLARMLEIDSRLRAAVARQIIARQVPLVGEVT